MLDEPVQVKHMMYHWRGDWIWNHRLNLKNGWVSSSWFEKDRGMLTLNPDIPWIFGYERSFICKQITTGGLHCGSGDVETCLVCRLMLWELDELEVCNLRIWHRGKIIVGLFNRQTNLGTSDVTTFSDKTFYWDRGSTWSPTNIWGHRPYKCSIIAPE